MIKIFVRCTDDDGKPVYINIFHIKSLIPIPGIPYKAGNGCRIIVGDADDMFYDVRETFGEVQKLVNDVLEYLA